MNRSVRNKQIHRQKRNLVTSKLPDMPTFGDTDNNHGQSEQSVDEGMRVDIWMVVDVAE